MHQPHRNHRKDFLLFKENKIKHNYCRIIKINVAFIIELLNSKLIITKSFVWGRNY